MKSIEIRIALTTLDVKLKKFIRGKKHREVSEITGLRKQDLNAYVRNRHTWSWKKILDIAGRLGL